MTPSALPALLIDMDGVLVKTLELWLGKYNTEFDENLHPKDITRWNFTESIPGERLPRMVEYMHEPGFFRYMEPVEGGCETLAQLHREGYAIVIATAPPHGSRTAAYDKVQWVKEHLPFLDPQEQMVLTHAKHLIKADIMLDDNPALLEPYPGTTVCMPFNYNHGVGDVRIPDHLTNEQKWGWFYGFVHQQSQEVFRTYVPDALAIPLEGTP